MAVSLQSVPNVPAPIDEAGLYKPIDQPLNVLLVIESAGGGSGRHVIDLAAGLVELGHSVTIVYSPVRADVEFIASLKEVGGIRLHPIPMHRATGWQDFRSVSNLRRFIRESGPFDIAHAHSSKAGAILRLAAPRQGIPCVYTPHALVTLDNELSFFKRLFFVGAERILSVAVDRIICVSEEEHEHARTIGLPSRKLRIVHNGISPLPTVDRQALRVELGLTGDEICIGCVGRLSPAKSIGRLISAFALVYQAFPNLRLLIVGDGPERARLESLAREIGVFDRVIFTGTADGPALMAAMDIFVLSSRYEGFPYVLLEAQARGLPVIMTEVGGARALVENGRNGFVVPHGHIEMLAQRISELAVSPERRQSMGAYSRKLVSAFDLRQMLAGTLSVYAEILNRADSANEDQ